MDPLVAEYLKKKQGLDQGVEDARTRSEWMAVGSDIGNQIAQAATPQNTVIYEKGWNETGAPTVDRSFANKAADFSGLKSMGQRQLQAAQENRNQGLADFEQTQKLTDLSTRRDRDSANFAMDQNLKGADLQGRMQSNQKGSRELKNAATLDDPSSPLAASMRNIVKSMDPGAQVEGLSGQEILTAYPMLKDKLGFALDQDRINASKIKATAPDTRAVERLGKDTDDKAAVLNAFDNVEALLGRPLQTGVKGQPDVPGMNVPGVGRVNFYDANARQLDSAISAITNEIARTNFGASQSAGELKRLAAELSTGRFNTEADRMDALARMKSLYIKALQETQSKYPEAVRNQYRDQGGMVGTDLKAPAPTNRPSAVRDYDAMSDEELAAELQRRGL